MPCKGREGEEKEFIGFRNSISKGPEARGTCASSGTEAGQCVRIVVVQGERAIFRAVKHSYFIAVSNSASWIPQRTLTWSPFSMKYLEVEKVR